LRDRFLMLLAPPTGRGLLVLLIALTPIAMGVRFPSLVWLGLALTLVAYGVLCVDRARAPGRTRLEASRAHPPTFPVGRASEVTLHVVARGGALGAGTPALVRDEHPVDVPASAEVQSTVFRDAVPATLSYTLTPPARGVRRFGDVVVRTPGPWRLSTRQTSLSVGEDAVVVDPDLSAVQAFEALARRGQLAELGVRALRRYGEGTEFERIREAVADDPMRSINWKATARTGRLMATELVPERAQTVVVCIDTGRLMGVGAGALTKLDHALSAALLLAHVALRTGDRVGFVAFASGVTAAVPARPGRVQLGALLQAARPLQPADVDADFDELGEYLQRTQRRRALLTIFTDVVDPDQGQSLVTQCLRLQRRHLPLAVTVRDPALDDAAHARPRRVAEAYSRAVAAGMLSDRAAVLRTLQRSGVGTLDADARSLSPRLINRYLEVKRRARL
jgi:uncharacterized protein (DUF58 family)